MARQIELPPDVNGAASPSLIDRSPPRVEASALLRDFELLR